MDDVLLQAAEALSNERGLAQETVFEAIQEGLESAAAKSLVDKGEDEGCNVRVAINQKTGEYKTFRRWLIVADGEIESEGGEIKLSDAKKSDPKAEVGGWVEEQMESLDFSRIVSNHAMPVVRRKIQEATRQRVVEQFQPKLGMLVQGTIKKVTRDNIIVDLGDNAEALLPRNNTIPHEILRTNDRIRALLSEITQDPRGPQLVLDRISSEMLRQLFRIEVPEISEGVISLHAVARIAGSRAKIAVSTKDHRIDPVGACVGMRGSRVQAVSNQLYTERIDVVLWDDNPLQLVANAMSPAKVISMSADETNMSVDLAVSKDDLSQAIGRSGENARLVEELTGLRINIMTEEELSEKLENDQDTLVQQFITDLDVDKGIARALTNNQFYLLDDIAEVEISTLTSIPGFSAELAEELQRRSAVHIQEKQAAAAIASGENLTQVEGIDDDTSAMLKAADLKTLYEIADLDSFELVQQVSEVGDEETAGNIIMAARAWTWAREEEEERLKEEGRLKEEAAAAEEPSPEAEIGADE